MRSCTITWFLVFITLFVKGQTIIPAGNVSGTWTAEQSPFHVQGDIVIPLNASLIIQPGVQVYFDGNFQFMVRGRLDAQGNPADSILFTANNSEIGWRGFNFFDVGSMIDSSRLSYCVVTHGKKTGGGWNGAAFYIYQYPYLAIKHCRISDNFVESSGAGIYMLESSISIMHTLIKDNQAINGTGGISCFLSAPFMYDVVVTGNQGADVGGIYMGADPEDSYTVMKQVVIKNNIGAYVGGLALQQSSSLVLDGCRILYNEGGCCGGIGFYDLSELNVHDTLQPSSIYLNKGGKACDLYCDDWKQIEIKVDTFTLADPDEYHVYPKDQFEYVNGIQNGILVTIDTSLFISPFGSDTNDGLSPESALKSFDYGLRRINGEPGTDNKLLVLPGHYHLAESDSGSAIYLKENVPITPVESGQVILDGDSVTRVIVAWDKENLLISGFKIRNGFGIQEFNGGGLFLRECEGIISNCELEQNKAYEGGAAYLEQNCKLIFNSCSFHNNMGFDVGGGIMLFEIDHNDSVLFKNCSFLDNYCQDQGGAINCHNSNVRLNNCLFQDNTADNYGGGCTFEYNSYPVLVNCSFIGNTSGVGGGGAFFYFGDLGRIVNSTFSNNQSTSGTAILQYGFQKLESTNSIFYNTQVQPADMIRLVNDLTKDTMCFLVDHSDIQGGINSIVNDTDSSYIYWLDGNIQDYPCYIDPENDNFSLNWCSPCIEAGREDTTGLCLPAMDLDGNPRIVNSKVDMGAYEYQLPVSISVPQPLSSDIFIYYDVRGSNINIEFPENLTDKILYTKIIKMDGTELMTVTKQSGLKSITIAISDISPGIYLVVISDYSRVIHSTKIPIFR